MYQYVNGKKEKMPTVEGYKNVVFEEENYKMKLDKKEKKWLHYLLIAVAVLVVIALLVYAYKKLTKKPYYPPAEVEKFGFRFF